MKRQAWLYMEICMMVKIKGSYTLEFKLWNNKESKQNQNQKKLWKALQACAFNENPGTTNLCYIEPQLV